MEDESVQEGQAQDVRFTESDISDYRTLVAVNCFYAEMKCDERMYKKCRVMNPEMWRKCPKQTKKVYRHKEQMND